MDKSLKLQLSKLPLPTKNIRGEWPEAEEWPQLKAVAVCQTEGCPMQGIGFEVTLYVQGDGSLYCICARCSNRVTDLRGDLTPVGQDKLHAYRTVPDLFNEKVAQFKKRGRLTS